ncbi:GIY-YIG nuclease family protein [Candidatus Dependentiae bacterium]|nr:GIY-YIG nuclease family protein [Candidatus Dependentiae bacterium]
MIPEFLQKIPKLPGVYVFKDTAGIVLYIGKAKNLYNRVSSYFKNTTDWKVQELIKEHASVEHIITKSEIEALLLEAQLIGKIKPKYNVLLKSGNPFVYLMVSQDTIPQLKLVRIKKEKGLYFGPFIYKQKVRTVYEYILRMFKLRLCSTRIEQGCLDYHMNRCAGNCLSSFNSQDYLVRLELAQKLLEGNYKACQELLKSQITEHNKKLEFEKSKHLSIYLRDLEVIFDILKTGFSENKYVSDVTLATMPVSYKISYPTQALEALQELLHLPTRPVSIDCFDISHFQSSYLVGSCVRFSHGIPDKNNFRRFKIGTVTTQNDYAALQEIVSRRYKDTNQLPDVILIDGGKGQLSAVRDLFPQVPFISLAKREETLYTALHPEGVKLDIQTPMGQLLIGLRDYAHHFAVTYHKTLRHKGLRSY